MLLPAADGTVSALPDQSGQRAPLTAIGGSTRDATTDDARMYAPREVRAVG